jgi:hypothetical protein
LETYSINQVKSKKIPVLGMEGEWILIYMAYNALDKKAIAVTYFRKKTNVYTIINAPHDSVLATDLYFYLGGKDLYS